MVYDNVTFRGANGDGVVMTDEARRGSGIRRDALFALLLDSHVESGEVVTLVELFPRQQPSSAQGISDDETIT